MNLLVIYNWKFSCRLFYIQSNFQNLKLKKNMANVLWNSFADDG